MAVHDGSPKGVRRKSSGLLRAESKCGAVERTGNPLGPEQPDSTVGRHGSDAVGAGWSVGLRWGARLRAAPGMERVPCLKKQARQLEAQIARHLGRQRLAGQGDAVALKQAQRTVRKFPGSPFRDGRVGVIATG